MNLSFNKASLTICLMTLLNLKAFAQDGDEDAIDPETSFYMILAGAAFLAVGALIAQVKFAEGFGKIIMGIGFFLGGLGIVGLALILLAWAVKTAVTLALFVGAIALVGYILYQVYLFLLGNKKEQ